jgi:hypothetical protein
MMREKEVFHSIIIIEDLIQETKEILVEFEAEEILVEEAEDQ